MTGRIAGCYVALHSAYPLAGSRGLSDGLVELVACVPDTFLASDGLPAMHTGYVSVVLLHVSNMVFRASEVMELFQDRAVSSSQQIGVIWEVSQDG